MTDLSIIAQSARLSGFYGHRREPGQDMLNHPHAQPRGRAQGDGDGPSFARVLQRMINR